MYTKWTTHCSNEHEKTQFEADLRRAKPILDRLLVILDQREKEFKNNSDLDSLFGQPNWPYFMAGVVGATSEIEHLRKLIDLDKQKDNTNE